MHIFAAKLSHICAELKTPGCVLPLLCGPFPLPSKCKGSIQQLHMLNLYLAKHRLKSFETWPRPPLPGLMESEDMAPSSSETFSPGLFAGLFFPDLPGLAHEVCEVSSSPEELSVLLAPACIALAPGFLAFFFVRSACSLSLPSSRSISTQSAQSSREAPLPSHDCSPWPT